MVWVAILLGAEYYSVLYLVLEQPAWLVPAERCEVGPPPWLVPILLLQRAYVCAWERVSVPWPSSF